MRHTWGVLAGVLSCATAHAEVLRSQVDVLPLPAGTGSVLWMDPLPDHRLLFRAGDVCAVIESDLSTSGFFDCATPAPPGSAVALIIAHDDVSFEARDRDGKLITGSVTRDPANHYALATDGSSILQLEDADRRRARLLSADGATLVDWMDLPELVTTTFPGRKLVGAHDGTGWVIAWSLDFAGPEFSRVYMATLDIVGGTPVVGPISELTGPDDPALERYELRLQCAAGRCILSWESIPSDPGLLPVRSWVVWAREASPELVGSRHDHRGLELDIGGGADELRFFPAIDLDTSTQGLMRIDPSDGRLVDEAYYPQTTFDRRRDRLVRLGPASVGLWEVREPALHLLVDRYDYVPGGQGAACSIPSDCSAGLECSLGACQAAPEPDAGTPDAAPVTADAAVLPDGATICPQGGGSCEGTGCSCQVGHERSAAPLGALLCLALLLRIRRRQG